MTRSSLQVGVGKLKKWFDDESQVLQNTLAFQRHSGVWTVFGKSNLIWSMLADSYIPPIVLLKDKSGTDSKGKDAYIYLILDGLQRLTSVFSFINDEWVMHGSTPSVSFDGFEYDIAGKKFSELEEELRNAIVQYRFIVQSLEDYTMSEAESLFFNINSGVALSSVQKAKPRMGSSLIKFFTELLRGTFFTQAVHLTEIQAKREDDLLLLIQSAMLLDNRHEGQDYKNISAASCLAYAEAIRRTYNADKMKMLGEIVHYLDKAFTAKNKFLSKNNVPIVVVMSKVALDAGVRPKDFAGFINTFANNIYPSYKEASGSGNVKAKQVQMRLRIMFLAFCKHFELSVEDVKNPFADEIPLYERLQPEDGFSLGGNEQAGSEGEAAEGGNEPVAVRETPITDSIIGDMESSTAENTEVDSEGASQDGSNDHESAENTEGVGSGDKG